MAMYYSQNSVAMKNQPVTLNLTQGLKALQARLTKYLAIIIPFVFAFSLPAEGQSGSTVTLNNFSGDIGFLLGEANGDMYFVSNGSDQEFYKFDSNHNVTQVTSDFPAYTNSVVMRFFHIFNDNIYFSSRRGSNPLSFTKLNTTTGNIEVYNTSYSDPNQWFEFNGELFFTANKSGTGRQLFKFNDVTNTITQVTTDNAPAGIMPNNQYYEVYNGKLYTSGYLNHYSCGGGAYTCISNHEFIIVDLATGNVTTHDLRPGKPSGQQYHHESAPKHFLIANGFVYFAAAASNGSNRQLWRYDISNGGAPSQLTNFSNTGGGDDAVSFPVEADNKIFFATQGSNNSFYVYDPATNNVSTINTGNVGFITTIGAKNGNVYVTGWNGSSGGVYKINTSTLSFTNLNAGTLTNYWRGEYMGNDQYIVRAATSANGTELFYFDATTENFDIIYDANPGSGSSNSSYPLAFNNTLYATGRDNNFVNFLYTLSLPGSMPASNNAPVFNNQTIAVDENSTVGTLVDILAATDGDGDPLTYTITGGNTGNVFSISNDSLLVNSSLDHEGIASYNLSVKVSDGTDSATATITVNVNDVNEQPTIALTNANVDENSAQGTVINTAAVTDPDNDTTRTFTIISQSTANMFAVVASTGVITVGSVNPNHEQLALAVVQIEVTDHGGLKDTAQMIININDVDDAPTLVSNTVNTVEDSAINVVIASGGIAMFSDEDGDTATAFDVVSVPTNGILLYNGDTMTVGTYPADAGNSIVYKPNQDANGTDSWSWNLQAGSLYADAAATMDINIAPVNDAPVVVSHSFTIAEDDQLHIPSAFTHSIFEDVDGDDIDRVMFTVLPLHGDLYIQGGNPVLVNTEYTNNQLIGLTYVPDSNYAGLDSMTFTAADADVYANNTAQFFITINAQNDAPVVYDAAFVMNEDEAPITVSTAVNQTLFTDTDGDTMQHFQLITAPVNGTLWNGSTALSAGDVITNAEASTMTYQPNAEYSGSDSFVWNGSDGITYATTSATVSITILPFNDAPTALILSANSIDENAPIGTLIATLSTSDIDPNDTHFYNLVPGTGDEDNALFSVSGTQLTNGQLFNYENRAVYSIRLSVSDAAGASYEEAFSIFVNDQNDAPTSVTLSNNVVAESAAQGSIVGILSTTDEDAIDSHTYSLVAGNGDTDNASFQINNTTLQSNVAFDYDVQQTYSVRVRATDAAGAFTEATYIIQVTDDNAAPTDITLSAATILENNNAGSQIGTLNTVDSDFADTHTYSLVAGAGDTDNANFSINGNIVVTTTSFDHETQPTQSIRIRTTDGANNTYEEVFTITVQDVNEAPTVVSLNGNVINETAATGTTIGTFATTDVDANDSHTYTFVQGAGAADNAAFTITNNTLMSNAVYDFETKDTYTIRVRSTDAGNNWIEDVFTINITDGNDKPTDVTITVLHVDENSPIGSAIGFFSTLDPDTLDAFTYTLVSGAGSTDNGSFSILANKLQVNDHFNFETKNSYDIRVRSTDSNGGSIEKAMTIGINDINEVPLSIASNVYTLTENQPLSTVVADLSTNDVDAGDSHTYALVAGAGDADNALFTISGNQIVTDANLNWEQQSTYSVRVATYDQGALSTEKQITISITDANDPAVGLSINKTVANNSSVGFYSRDFTRAYTDEDGDVIVGLTIGSLPLHGTVTLKGNPVSVGQYIALNEMPEFIYTPNRNFAGNDSFEWFAHDGTDNGVVAGTINIGVQLSRTASGPRAVGTTITFPGSLVNNSYRPNSQRMAGEADDEMYSLTDITNAATQFELSLEQNFPNPFGNATTINFELPVAAKVEMRVYDLLGKEVATLINTEMDNGKQSVTWNGTNNAGNAVTSGKYILQMVVSQSGTVVGTKTISMAKF